VLNHFFLHLLRFPLAPAPVSFRPSAFSLRSLWFLSTQLSVAVAILRLSVQLLVRSALRPVGSFHYSPWVVVTPPTTTASADFCLLPGRPPRIRFGFFPLTLAAFTWDYSDPFWTLLSVASLSGIPCLSTRFLFIESRFCSPASFPRSLALSQLPSASGSSGQRPQETFTP
jgi:hypothetical protein